MLSHYLQFAQNYWHPEITGATISPALSCNTDTCYPLSEDDKIKIPGLAIVCRAIAGMRGEGANNSNITITSFQEKISALFADLYNGQQDIASTSLEFLIESIETIFARTSQDIFLRNQAQGLSDGYGVSVVLALYFPRHHASSADFPDGQIAHEIYVAHVGCCRAYWLTSKSCHQLTLDDNFANQEIASGRSTHEEMLEHPFANIPMKLLGRSIEGFKPNIKRVILREDGVLMLCSSRLTGGFNDNSLVERWWQTSMQDFFQSHVSFQDLARVWLNSLSDGYPKGSIALMKLIR
jgi:protein phosphatase